MSAPSTTQPVAATDRVNDVLARDESLVEVFIYHSSHFTKLRNRTMRKVMGRLVTVDDAARIADVPVDALVRHLNEALGIATPDAPADAPAAAPATAPAAREHSASATHPADAPVVEVDVREDLRAGREPLARIMGAATKLNDGEVLRVRATFQPVPLLTVLGKRGFASESLEHGPDDWSVWFWREAAKEATPASDAASSRTSNADAPSSGTSEPNPVSSRTSEANPASSRTSEPNPVSSRTSEASVGTSAFSDENSVWLDVRGLHPPEPLMRTLAALDALPAGHQLVHINERVPQLLLPMLAERGFACELDDSRSDRVLLRIWHST